MNDFATRFKKPSAAEYLAATEAELIERLNNNPSGSASEQSFIEAVLAVRTAESHRKTNEELVKQTRFLVYATWAVCAATVFALIVSIVCK